VGRYPRVKVFARNLEIRSAQISDLKPLRATIIERGGTIIRTGDRPGDDQAASVKLPARVQHSHAFEVPNLYSLSGLVVKVGDRLPEGQSTRRQVCQRLHPRGAPGAYRESRADRDAIQSRNPHPDAVYTMQTSNL
jgi:hypothetical protein